MHKYIGALREISYQQVQSPHYPPQYHELEHQCKNGLWYLSSWDNHTYKQKEGKVFCGAKSIFKVFRDEILNKIKTTELWSYEVLTWLHCIYPWNNTSSNYD